VHTFLTQSPEEKHAFYHAHMIGDGTTKHNYHEQYFPETLVVLQKHVDYLVNELDELSENSWRRTFRKGDDRNPRLPLILRHNNFVRETFQLVQQYLDGLTS
jgi:hypothetical protein